MSLRNAVDMALRTARRVDDSTITYTRGNATLPGIVAAMGDSEYEVQNADGMFVELHTSDFIVAVCDLTETFGVPEENDEIAALMLDGTTSQFTVTAPSPEPTWRYSDNYHSHFRIHTKRIDGQ